MASRICFLCLRVEPVVDEAGWIDACLCMWSHVGCVTNLVVNREAVYPQHEVKCPWCYTAYRVHPPLEPAHRATLRALNILYECGEILSAGVTKGFTVFALIMFNARVGSITLSVLGVEGSLGMKLLVPWIGIVVCSIPWEHKFLGILRAFGEIPIVGGIFPTSDVTSSVMVPRRNRVSDVINGLLLPAYARVVGDLLFSSVTSRVARALHGGVFFLLVKWGFNMYYLQKRDP